MTKEQIDSVLTAVRSWPEEDQQEFIELAREIEARRGGVYDPTPEEEAAIREGLAQLERGEWTDSDEMKAFWKRCGVL